MMYYQEEEGTFFIFYHDECQSNLPFQGWIHNCIFCHLITSNTEDYIYKKERLKILTCKKCYKSIDNNKDILDSWIAKNIPKFRCLKRY